MKLETTEPKGVEVNRDGNHRQEHQHQQHAERRSRSSDHERIRAATRRRSARASPRPATAPSRSSARARSASSTCPSARRSRCATASRTSIEPWTTESTRERELKSLRTQVTRELNRFERRGGQARRKATQRARSTRNRVEREVKPGVARSRRPCSRTAPRPSTQIKKARTGRAGARPGPSVAPLSPGRRERLAARPVKLSALTAGRTATSPPRSTGLRAGRSLWGLRLRLARIMARGYAAAFCFQHPGVRADPGAAALLQ